MACTSTITLHLHASKTDQAISNHPSNYELGGRAVVFSDASAHFAYSHLAGRIDTNPVHQSQSHTLPRKRGQDTSGRDCSFRSLTFF